MNTYIRRLSCLILAATVALPWALVARGQGVPPALGPARGASEPDRVVKAYPVVASQADAVLRQLGERFPASSGVKITYDPRTSQILAIAPRGVQEQIAAALQMDRGGQADAGPVMAPVPQPAQGSAGRGP